MPSERALEGAPRKAWPPASPRATTGSTRGSCHTIAFGPREEGGFEARIQIPLTQAPMTLRILIVDDEPPGVQALRGLLSREAGVEVVGEAFNGLQALGRFRALKPDLVLLDI